MNYPATKMAADQLTTKQQSTSVLTCMITVWELGKGGREGGEEGKKGKEGERDGGMEGRKEGGKEGRRGGREGKGTRQCRKKRN